MTHPKFTRAQREITPVQSAALAVLAGHEASSYLLTEITGIGITMASLRRLEVLGLAEPVERLHTYQRTDLWQITETGRALALGICAPQLAEQAA